MNRPIAALLSVATVDRIILQGIYPILPVMIASRGASTGDNGLFMAVVYMAIAAGSWLTPRILRLHASVGRLSVMIAGFTAASLIAMGYAASYGSFLAATACYWFLCGVQINIYSILMSFISPSQHTGRNFGLLANTTLAGAIVGGLVIGPAIRHMGTQGGFMLFAIVTILARLVILMRYFDVVYARYDVHTTRLSISLSLWILLLTFNTGIMLSFIGRFDISLLMKEAGYNIDAISRLFAYGALAVLPLPYLFGWLSQRIEGKWLLSLSLACTAIAMLLLYKPAGYVPFFWAGFLICVMTYCSRGVSQKIIYDLYPVEQQKRAQSMLASANWVAAIFGFVLAGATSAYWSLSAVSLVCCFAGLIAAGAILVFPIGQGHASR